MSSTIASTTSWAISGLRPRPGAITLEAALSYLGLGAVPPTPSLGSMLSENRSAMELAPWTVLYPGIALAILVLCINMFGDAVRDYLDPRLRTATNP